MAEGFRVIETAYYFVPTLKDAVTLAKDGREKGRYTEIVTENKYQSEILGKNNWQDLMMIQRSGKLETP